MTFLPVVQRELAVAARRSSTYWIRFWAATVAMLVAFNTLIGRLPGLGQDGRMLFDSLGHLGFVFCWIAGVRYTADVLSRERREGTLGLLFLTDLGSYDVVLGKLMSVSLDAVLIVLAICPMLALPILMGGVSLGDLQRVAAVWLVTLFWSLSIGLLVSSLGKDERKVALTTFLIVAALVWGRQVLVGFGVNSRIDSLLVLTTPAYALEIARQRPFNPAALTILSTSLLVTFSIALACVVAACVVLPRKLVTGGDFQSRSSKDPAKGFVSRAKDLDASPGGWLVRSGPGITRVYRVVLACFWMILFWVLMDPKALPSWSGPRSPGMLIYQLLTVFEILTVVEACWGWGSLRASGALELLLCTPLDIRSLVLAHARRRSWYLAGAVTAMVIIFSIWMEHGMVPSSSVLSVAKFILGCRALMWVGMWRSLAGHGFARSAISTYLLVMLPTWMLSNLTSWLMMSGPSIIRGQLILVYNLEVTLSLVYLLWITRRARKAMLNRFRERASEDERVGAGLAVGS